MYRNAIYYLIIFFTKIIHKYSLFTFITQNGIAFCSQVTDIKCRGEKKKAGQDNFNVIYLVTLFTLHMASSGMLDLHCY